MAKISANGATKVESIKTTLWFPNPEDASLLPLSITYTHTLCSDGRILRKNGSDGYRKVAKIKRHVPDQVKTFRAYVRRFEAARS